MNRITVLVICTLSLLGCERPVTVVEPLSLLLQTPTLAIYSQEQLVAEEVFNLGLEFETEVEGVKGRLVSETMAMGIVPIYFKSNDQRVFNAQSIVGACALQKMVWRLELTWLEQGKIKLIEVPLTITR